MNFKNILIVISIIISSLTLSAQTSFVVSKEAYNALSEQPKIKAQIGESLLIEMSQKQQLEMSHFAHTKKGLCAGFVQVIPEDKGETAKESLANYIYKKKSVLSLKPNFTKVQLTNDKVIKKVGSLLTKNRYSDFLNTLASMNNRNAKKPEGKRASDFIYNEVAHILSVKQKTAYNIKRVATPGYQQDSIVVTIYGTNSQLPGVLIGAHLDTILSGFASIFGGLNPGADDDASGSALLLENLKAFVESGVQLKRDIHFAFYAAEEHGLVGSQYVVRDFEASNKKILAAAQFDMVGYNSSRDSNDFYFIRDNTSDALTNVSKSIVKKYLKNLKTGDTKCNYECSDHASWHRVGTPVIFPFEASFSNYNTKIHTTNDKMSYLDMDHAFNFVKFASAFLIEMGNH